MKVIPYGRQYIDKSDINAVRKSLTNDLITTGKEVIKFEKLFSKKVGVKYSVSCSSGTAALLLSYLALGIKKNDIILTPSINFIASVNMAEFINAKIYHLTNYLKFVNFVDSPMSYMPFFDLLILPTYEETFGLVAAEAMIMGVPVIGSNAGGVPEIISHGSNGLLFETKNASDLSEKIDMLYENKTLREQLVSNAFEYAYKRYNYDKHFGRLEEIFDSL